MQSITSYSLEQGEAKGVFLQQFSNLAHVGQRTTTVQDTEGDFLPRVQGRVAGGGGTLLHPRLDEMNEVRDETNLRLMVHY